MKLDKDDITVLERPRRPSQPRKYRRETAARLAEEKKTMMKAAAIDRFGPPSVLTLHTLPVPEPGPGEVLIALHAAGVGVWDTEIRGGWWPQGRPKFPLVLGSDGAGIIAGKGARVRRFNIGDRVWASEFINPKGGFYAEYIAVNADHIGRVPRRLDLLQAAAGAVTGLTGLQGIDEHLRIRQGETVLIFGATGAVGTLSVQFAKRRKAHVIGTARDRKGIALLRHLGADGVINPADDGAMEQLRVLAPKGLDAVLALAGGDVLERCLELVRPGGRVAYPNGVEPEPRQRPKLRIVAYNGQASPRHFARFEQAVDEARLQVPIAAVYPLAQAAKAHERIEQGHVVGRIALRIREG